MFKVFEEEFEGELFLKSSPSKKHILLFASQLNAADLAADGLGQLV